LSDDEEESKLDGDSDPIQQRPPAGQPTASGSSADSTFLQLSRFAKQKVSQAHKKEIMFVDFYDS